MKPFLCLAGAVLAIALAGCGTTGTTTRTAAASVVPGPMKTQDQFAMEDVQCREYAAALSGISEFSVAAAATDQASANVQDRFHSVHQLCMSAKGNQVVQP